MTTHARAASIAFPQSAAARARGRAVLVVAAVALAFVAVPAMVAEAQTVSPAITVLAPGGAATNPDAVFLGVSCTSAGNCTAVGRYRDSAGRQQPLVGAETNGAWSRGTAVTLPSDAGSGSSGFNGVSCSSAGNCTAVGSYRDNTGAQQVMTAAEVDGTWAQAAKLNLPTDAARGPVLSGVSCTSVGNCVTAGNYTDSSGYQRAMVATQTSGVWGQAAKVTAPSDASTNPGGFLGPVSCTSVGNCVSVGSYVDSWGYQQGMVATQTSGVWGQAAKVTAPSDAATSANVALLGVSCPSAGNCSAAGNYNDSSNNMQPLTVNEVNGTWAQAAKVASPVNARTTSPRAFFGGRSANVSCWSAGNCIAVGGYYDANGLQNMTATQTNGTWARAVQSSVPADAAINPDAGFSAVSCVAGGACTAAGDYANTSGNYNAMAANVIGDQAITFTSSPPSNATVGGSTYTVAATGGGSSGPVTFSVDPGTASTCALTGFTVTFTGAGTCTINANQAGDANYNASPQAQQTFQVSPDSTPPVITSTLTGTTGLNGWYTSAASVSWSVTDPESAVSSASGCDTTVINADTAGTTLSCSATSSGGTSNQAVTIKVDTAAPTITVTGGPTDGAAYAAGGVPAPTCTAVDTTSGLSADGCTIASGYSTAVGDHTVTYNASDNAGNAATVTRSYGVTDGFGGFQAPLSRSSTVIKSSAAIPVKFTLLDAASAAVTTATTRVVLSSGVGTGQLAVATCAYSTQALAYQCQIKTPVVQTGRAYYLTVQELLAGKWTTVIASTAARTTNPITITFK